MHRRHTLSQLHMNPAYLSSLVIFKPFFEIMSISIIGLFHPVELCLTSSHIIKFMGICKLRILMNRISYLIYPLILIWILNNFQSFNLIKIALLSFFKQFCCNNFIFPAPCNSFCHILNIFIRKFQLNYLDFDQKKSIC